MIVFLLCSSFVSAQDVTMPKDAVVVRTAEGRGVQVYRCGRKDSGYGWSFVAPEAKLIDKATGATVGVHGAGPTWTWKDGSAVTGSVVATEPAPTAGNVPWLLVSVKPVPETVGVLAGVAWVRRSDTVGGVAPTSGCDAAHKNVTERVAYSAVYTFFERGR